MKLASYRDGSRDGQLVVVSKNLKQAHYAAHIATRMQQVFDDWNFIAPQLEQLYQQLNQGKAPHPFEFDANCCMSPLPRPTEYLQGNAYTRPSQAPVALASPPCITQVHSSTIEAPHIGLMPDVLGNNLDFEAGLAVITDDIAYATAPELSIESIRLFMLNTNLIYRPLDAAEHNWLVEPSQQSHLMSLFSPVAITGDELGIAWQNGKINLRLDVLLNEHHFARIPANECMTHSFEALLSQACKTHHIATGCIIGSGVLTHTEHAKGYASFLQKRNYEYSNERICTTPYLQAQDKLSIEMKNKEGHSLFGTICVQFKQVKLPAL